MRMRPWLTRLHAARSLWDSLAAVELFLPCGMMRRKRAA